MKNSKALLILGVLLGSHSFAQVIPGGGTVASGPSSSIVGTLQTATGGTVKNGTLSFTLSQPAVVSGSSSIAASTVSCYTSNQGNIVGVPDPIVAPVLSVGTAFGTLPSGTYYVKITYLGANGESIASPESTAALETSTGTITVNPPALQPPSATGFYSVYIGTTSGGEVLQGTVNSWTSFIQNAPLVAGSPVPTNNSSSCNIYFSDQLVPTGTFYTVGLVNRNGSQIAGFPQTWCTYGGAGATINVSNGAPTGNCGTNGVFYPTPLFATPQGNSGQSVNSPITFNQQATFNAAVRMNGAITGLPSLNTSIIFANPSLGSTGGIQEAVNSCSIGKCLVFVTASATITAPISVANNNVELQCVGATLTAGANIQMITLRGGYDTVRNCKLDGQRSSFATSAGILTSGAVSPLIEHNNLVNFANSVGTPAAVYLVGTTNAIVQSNTFSNNSALAVYGENNTVGSLVSGNTIDETAGIAGAHAIAFHSTTSGMVVSDTRIVNNQITNGLGFCIEVGAFGGNHATNFVINDNTCKSGVAGSEGAYSIGSFTDGFSFHGNSFNANGFNSTIGFIEIVQGTDGAIIGNTAKIGTAWTSPTSAIILNRSSNVNVTGNTVDGFGIGANAAGIYLLTVTPGTAVNSDNIVGNSIAFPSGDTAGFGIWQQCADGTSTCSNNFFHGNSIMGVSGGSSVGLQVQNDAGTSDSNRLGINQIALVNSRTVIGSGVTNSVPQFDIGIANNGSGLKHKRATGCTTGSTSGNTCTTTVTWTTAFADANYTAVCTLLGPATLGHLAAISTDVIAAASVKVETVTDTNAAIAGTVDCIAIHD